MPQFGCFLPSLQSHFPERPYPHYLVQAAAPLSLLIGTLVANKTIEQSLTVIPITLFLFVTTHFGFWEYQTAPYYSRFISLINGSISNETYVASFGDNVTATYKVADYVQKNTHTTDTIFVWGDTSSVYALSERHPPIHYVTDFHINDALTHEELVSLLSEDKPDLVILFPNSNVPNPLLSFTQTNYILVETLDDVAIWKFPSD